MSLPSNSSDLRVKVLGAAGTVTGSKYLIESDKCTLMVDCGLFQGPKELRLRNWEEPDFKVKEIDAIILTHAHIDHSGNIPLLVKRGFRGPIYCTAATADLLRILLPDSGRLQEEEAEYANKIGSSKHHPARPLYTEADALNALPLLKPLPTKAPSNQTEKFEILPGVYVSTAPSGHILGAAIISIDISGKQRLTFSGDIGRYNMPLLKDPQGVELGDILFCESTYGNRLHDSVDIAEQMKQVIDKIIERNGPLIIPAFAVGRVQHLIYLIRELEQAGKIPELPVYIDSPMAVDVTAIYRKYTSEYDGAALDLLANGQSPLLTARTVFCQSVAQSKSLNALMGPRIVIAPSGMVNGGRIMHHMSQWLDKKEATILFVGFQAQGTRGNQIQSGANEVKFFGRYIPVRAQVETISGLSAHADAEELIRWLKSCRGTPATVRITHGEPDAAKAFAEKVQSDLNWNASCAEHGEVVK